MFQGTGTAILTPFDEQLNVDYASLKKLTRFQVDNKVDMIVVLGTTGESPVISGEERKKIIETVMAESAGKTKIIVGTGTNDTRKTVKLNRMAEDLKADGVLVVNPYYNKSTQAGLVENYKHISEHCGLPIVLYNVPSRTAMNMLPETILNIHDTCKNVVAVKEACGDISQIARLCAYKPDTLTVLSGNDDQTIPMMALGAKGVISVFSNVYPKEMKSIIDAMLEGHYDTALCIHNKYLKMINLLFVETSPSPVKYVASLLKLCKNILRLPLVPATRQAERLLAEELHLLEV